MTAQNTPATPAVAPPKKRRGALIAAVVIAMLVIGGLLFWLLRPAAASTVKLGVVGASEPYWDTYVAAAAEAGIEVELVDFADYNQPNPAVTEGELDLNQFQHIVYLAEYNAASGEDLTPIGSTAIYPLGLYSEQYTDVADIPAGSTVAIPSDPSNRARALLVLQSAGLITLTGGGSIFDTPADIDAAASKVTVKELDAALIGPALPDVAAGVINNDFVAKSGLSFADAIAKDDPNDPNALPYVNIFAATADRAADPVLTKLVEIYQNSPEVLAGVAEASANTAQPLKTPVADLQASLKKVEAETKAQG
ncbi:MetQ/NlpA family ABC transporter substrate-binding protein [Leucobacter sp. M11]|uniref:MetQ/NlpA family ABC transporter substrate-binding protein n=1 Tax=Leucobacter sp. M11 TaxID=2993565 RepID=UPI002D80B103|nr:MetQ/NlpA family ABC transporter substrate-binding protein [Leucobacter sp. M11]MEB4616130.1 MetQ/NlpA family ABC transporter substrate-binding protein [Leucobacter sp. M11]